jgi:hypothetical protein
MSKGRTFKLDGHQSSRSYLGHGGHLMMQMALTALVGLPILGVSSFQCSPHLVIPNRVHRRSYLKASDDNQPIMSIQDDSFIHRSDELQPKDLDQIRRDVLVRSSYEANDLAGSSDNGLFSPSTEATVSARLSKLVLIMLATYGSSLIMADWLVQFEWFQTWRYFWPLVGGVYAIDAIRGFRNNDNTNIGGVLLLPVSTNSFHHKSTLGRSLAFLSGIGLVIGGAYDAFMPVWYTGPNVFTKAGIGQDSAAILLLLTVLGILQSEILHSTMLSDSQRPVETSPQRMLLQALLIAQLYKLSEGTFDAILSNVASLFWI